MNGGDDSENNKGPGYLSTPGLRLEHQTLKVKRLTDFSVLSDDRLADALKVSSVELHDLHRPQWETLAGAS
jgi:hypothetical protein